MPRKRLSPPAVAEPPQPLLAGKCAGVGKRLGAGRLPDHGEIIGPDVLPLPSAEDQRGATDATPEQPEPEGTLAEEGDRAAARNPADGRLAPGRRPLKWNANTSAGPWNTPAMIENGPAARLLDMDRHQLRRRISWHGLDAFPIQGRSSIAGQHSSPSRTLIPFDGGAEDKGLGIGRKGGRARELALVPEAPASEPLFCFEKPRCICMPSRALGTRKSEENRGLRTRSRGRPELVLSNR